MHASLSSQDIQGVLPEDTTTATEFACGLLELHWTKSNGLRASAKCCVS